MILGMMIARLQLLSSMGDGLVRSCFEDCLVFFHNLHLCFNKPWVVFCSCEVTTMMVLRQVMYTHLTNFEFLDVAWA